MTLSCFQPLLRLPESLRVKLVGVVYTLPSLWRMPSTARIAPHSAPLKYTARFSRCGNIWTIKGSAIEPLLPETTPTPGYVAARVVGPSNGAKVGSAL